METRRKSRKKDKEIATDISTYDTDSFKLKDHLKNLDDVIVPSTIGAENPNDVQRQMQDVFEEFNKNVDPGKSCFTQSYVRGNRIDPGKFLLGERNKIPELAMYTPSSKTAVKFSFYRPATTTKKIGVHDQSETFYGRYGSYVLNVPQGMYALAWSGKNPVIYGPGPHVIHDKNFSFDPEKGLVNQKDYWIEHGPIHILRVPAGQIAKVLINSTPVLLESRDEPYVFYNPRFQFLVKNKQEDYYDATDPLIIHRTIKRIIPKNKEVVITFDGGILDIRRPTSTGEPIIINKNTHLVTGFLNTGIETLILPTENTKKQRLADNKDTKKDEINYEVFTTKDSVRVGVKLVLAYEIINPEVALTQLNDNKGILKHIENLAASEMSKAMKHYNSNDFQFCFQTTPPKPTTRFMDKLDKELSPDTYEAPLQNFQDQVKEKLSDDLRECGINLTRLSFEDTKILDKAVAKKMAEQAELTAETNTQEAVLEQQFAIAKRKAEQEAKVKEIAQKQQNETIISKAKAEFDAANLSKQAKVIDAEGTRDAAVIKGEQYEKNPQLFELDKLKIQMEALAANPFMSNPMMMMPQYNPGMGGMMSTPFNLFAANAQQQAQRKGVQQMLGEEGKEATPKMKNG